MKQQNVNGKIVSACEAESCKCDNKEYLKPVLTIYGDITEITLKQDGIKDHNKGNNNMGYKINDLFS